MSHPVQFKAAGERAYYGAEAPRPPSSLELERLLDDIQHWIPDAQQTLSDRRVLDLGAGTGPLGAVIATHYQPAIVVSLELVFERIRVAERLPRRVCVCGDTFHLPFAAGSFDVVLANSVLHHLPDVDEALSEISRVLVPGGVYVGREPNFNNPAVRARVFGVSGLGGSHHSPNEYPLRPETIQDGFRRMGCSCDLYFFWRRLPKLRHPMMSAAVSVRARRSESPRE